MEKIIKGKTYDTDRATCIGKFLSGDPEDFEHYIEMLYVKESGEFFLYGEGGPLSKYAAKNESRWDSGWDISPMPYDKARKWVSKHLSQDECKNIFREIVEDESKRHIDLHLSGDVISKIEILAACRGITPSELIEELVEKI